MAETRILDSKVSPEGRVVIPAEIRRVLGIVSGDRVRFLVEEDGVRLVSARLMADLVRANNPPESDADAARDIREARSSDQEDSDSWMHATTASGAGSEDEVAAEVLASLGLDR